MPIRLVDPKHPRRYKHSLRKSPYFVSLVFLLAATTLTLLNIYIPDLIRVVVRTPGPVQFETQYGLYQRCTRTIELDNAAFLAPSLPPNMTAYPEDLFLVTLPHNGSAGWECQDFPSRSECQEFGESFCVLWSTSGYAAQLSLVPCLMSLFSLLFIFLHRGQRTARARARRQQWKLVSVSMAVHFLLQILALALIVHVYRTDDRFDSSEASLHQSFLFGALSAVLSLIITALLTFTGIAARRGKPWAAGKSARHARRHRRTRSGQVISVPDGTDIPPEEVVTVGELEAARTAADERTGLLDGHASGAAGGSRQRATDA